MVQQRTHKISALATIPRTFGRELHKRDSDPTSHLEGPLLNCVAESGSISLLKTRLSTLSTFCAREEPTDLQKKRKTCTITTKYVWLLMDNFHRQRVLVTACAKCKNKRVVQQRTNKISALAMIPRAVGCELHKRDRDPTSHQEGPLLNCVAESGSISSKNSPSTLSTFCAREEFTDLQKKRKTCTITTKYVWLLPDHLLGSVSLWPPSPL